MRVRSLRLAGHPLHPALVHLPIGAWILASVGDAAALWTGETLWWQLAYVSLAAGLVAAAPASVVGAIDFLALPAENPGSRTALYHLVVELGAAAFYLASFLARRGPDFTGAPSNPGLAVALAATGLVLMIVGGWLGAELVYRYRVGVRTASGASDRIQT